MIKSLVAIYHSRVDYPGYIPPPSSSQKLTVPVELDSEERSFRYKNPADIPISPGGEIEDEASTIRFKSTKPKQPVKQFTNQSDF
jgi:hypothetical protein